MVVWPQRGRIFPDSGFPRHDVLFRSKAGRTPGVFLSLVHRPFLVADLSVYLGRTAPSALHRAARLGANAWYGVLNHIVDAKLGRHDQWLNDAKRRVGQDPHRPHHPHDGHGTRFLRYEHF